KGRSPGQAHRRARRRRRGLRLPAGPGPGVGGLPPHPARPPPARLGEVSAEQPAATAGLLLAFVMNRVDREHDREDKRLADVVVDIDQEFLPERELPGHPGDWHALLVDLIVPAAEVPSRRDLPVGRVDLVPVAEEALVMDLGDLLTAHLDVVPGGHQVLPDMRDLVARLITHGQVLAEAEVAAHVERWRSRAVMDHEMLDHRPLAGYLVAHL